MYFRVFFFFHLDLVTIGSGLFVTLFIVLRWCCTKHAKDYLRENCMGCLTCLRCIGLVKDESGKLFQGF